MTKIIGFLGGPSTGKTTLATSVFNALSEKGINPGWASEFVTDDVQENGAPDLDYYIYEQYRFLFHQSRREEEARKSSDIVITDSPLLIGYAYTLQKKEYATLGRQKNFINELAGLFAQDGKRYHHLYLLKREANFEDNGIRFHTQEESVAFDALLEEMLTKSNIPFTSLQGDVQTRTDAVLRDIL